MCVCIYIYIHIYIHIHTYTLNPVAAVVASAARVGRYYTVFLLPILYGVKHTSGRSEGESHTVQ